VLNANFHRATHYSVFKPLVIQVSIVELHASRYHLWLHREFAWNL